MSSHFTVAGSNAEVALLVVASLFDVEGFLDEDSACICVDKDCGIDAIRPEVWLNRSW